jgi:hypothetical protein
VIVWRAFSNDDVELSNQEGCKTKKEAISLCERDREYVMAGSSDGSDLGFEYHIEKSRETETEIEVLKEIQLKFG